MQALFLCIASEAKPFVKTAEKAKKYRDMYLIISPFLLKLFRGIIELYQ
jgi:hypothetical protein